MRADKAIILSTHILEEVEAICTRVIIIDRGRVQLDQTPDELRGDSGGTLRDRLAEVFRALTGAKAS